MNKETKLWPCPICYSKKVVFNFASFPDGDRWVYCEDCNYIQPGFHTENEAIALWNNRLGFIKNLPHTDEVRQALRDWFVEDDKWQELNANK